MTTATAGTERHWKTDIADLKSRAADVHVQPHASDRMSARAAAACLQGIFGLVTRRWNLEIAQRTCAELVRYEPSWESSFGQLPDQNGYVSEPTQLIAAVARSLLPICGTARLRAALSFWASEDDPAVWQSLSAA